MNNSKLARRIFSAVIKKQKPLLNYTSSRSYPAPPKRFYRNVNVLFNDDNGFEITLDQRKLKTPQGKVLRLNNETLALAVAAEWDAQKEIVNQSSMHLTALCNTATDNPIRLSKEDLVAQLLNFLDTDAILFHAEEDNALYQLQAKEWKPIIDWFNNRFSVSVQPVRDIMCPFGDTELRQNVQRHLNSYNLPCLQGISFAVESLKSLILTLCCLEREISVEKAIKLSRLEEDFQCEIWGRVEWSHDLNAVDLQARVAAAVMFIHLNLESSRTQAK